MRSHNSALSPLAERIKSRLDTLGKTPRGAAIEAGLGASTIRNIFENKSESPRGETLTKLSKVLETTEEWLLHGLTSDREPIDASPKTTRKNDSQSSNVLEIDVRAGAGGGGVPIEAWARDREGNIFPIEGVRDEWGLPATIMREMLHSSARHIRAFEVIGDSMEPRLCEGDRIFVDLRYTVPSPEGIFALWDGLGVVIKRVQVVRGADPPKVRIISINTSYEPYEATLEEVRIIGRYAGRFTVN
jgi:phage repressor protein C with HTH and peptisase S24 domain